MNGRTIAEDMEREYQRQSLRDTFAAAALTGLMARPEINSYGIYDDPIDFAPVTHVAYLWADAMLAERSRTGQKMAESDSFCASYPEQDDTNHDAAPAASVQQSTRDPERSLLAQSESVERGLPRTGDTPTLTDAEREAIERAIERLVGVDDLSHDSCQQDDGAACTLRGLLERLHK